MASDCREPLNLGSAELVSINQLVSLVEDIARVKLTRHYNPEAPVGVRGRNSDNFMIRHLLGWEPSVRLRDGLERTYFWIWNELAQGRAAPDLTAYSGATARP